MVRHAVCIRQLRTVAEGVLGLHELLRGEAVGLHVRCGQVVAVLAALLSGGRFVEAIVGELVRVVLEFGLVVALATQVKKVEDAEDEEEDDDSRKRKGINFLPALAVCLLARLQARLNWLRRERRGRQSEGENSGSGRLM